MLKSLRAKRIPAGVVTKMLAARVTIEEYETRLRNQKGTCAICETATLPKVGVFHVDHCHTTNAVRGLLCNRCNTGLGMFGESAIVLEKALCYMRQSNSAAALAGAPHA